MGSEFFDKVQYGKESTKGTIVPATRMWIGQMQAIKTDVKPKFPKEHFGIRADAFRAVVHQRLYTNTLSVEDGCFEHLPVLFGSGLKGGVTPTETTGGQGDYLGDWSPSLSAANNPDALTIRMGDDAQAWVAEYCMFERIRISGQVTQGMDNSPVKIEADFFGRQLAQTTFTGAISGPPLEPINAKLARLYIDPTWANVGTTELANLLRTFSVEILTGVHSDFTGSVLKTFDAAHEGVIGVMATFGIEGGATAAAKLVTEQAGSLQVARLEITGKQIGTGTNHKLTLDIGGMLEDASPIAGEDRGDNQGTIMLHSAYDFTGAKTLGVKLTTDMLLI